MATSPITKPLQNIETKHIRIIGVPLDLGQSRRGVDMGPSAMRVAGLEAQLEALGHKVKDAGNVAVAMAETKAEGDPHAKYLKEITETCTKEAELVLKTLESGADPDRPGRRPLHRRRHRVRRRRVLSPQDTSASACSGLTRTPTSTLPTVRPAATCTACRWAPSWDCSTRR